MAADESDTTQAPASAARNTLLAVLRQWLGYCASTACADAIEQAGFERAGASRGRAEAAEEHATAILRGVVEALGESWSDWSEEPWQDIVAEIKRRVQP